MYSPAGYYMNNVDLINQFHLTNWYLLVKFIIYLKQSLHHIKNFKIYEVYETKSHKSKTLDYPVKGFIWGICLLKCNM